ncbi:MAG: diguanylate cyclase domain-containing protein [Vulcanococcus sp.]
MDPGGGVDWRAAQRRTAWAVESPGPGGLGRDAQLTLSIGMVEMGSEGRHQLTELLQAADAALYVAKDLGRNQVMDLQRQHPKGWTMQPA